MIFIDLEIPSGFKVDSESLREKMKQIHLALSIILGLALIVGCGRSAAPPKSSEPMSPEEAALDIVTAIYTIRSQVKEDPPESWDDLNEYASGLRDPARKDALEAIQKIKDLGYKVTWGIDKAAVEAEQANATEFVIIESPDGKLKSTFGGVIIKAEPAANPGNEEPKEDEPDEPVFEPNRTKPEVSDTDTK